MDTHPVRYSSMDCADFRTCFKCEPVVGELFKVEAGAPGTGWFTYRILTVTATELRYVHVWDNVRELTPGEVA